MDTMKPHQYREMRNRHKKAGVFAEVPEDKRKEVIERWKKATERVTRIEAVTNKRTINHIDNILLSHGVDVADIDPKKLFPYLNGSLQFKDLVVILGESIPDKTRALRAAEELFVAVERTPPIQPEVHREMVLLQEKHMPAMFKPNEHGFVAKEWVKRRMRPLFESALHIEAQAAQEEAYKRQSFLSDGVTPAGVQHALRQRVESDATINHMAIDTPRTGETPQNLAQLKERILSLTKSSPDFKYCAPAIQAIISDEDRRVFSIKIPGKDNVRIVKQREGETVTLTAGDEKVVFSKEELDTLMTIVSAEAEIDREVMERFGRMVEENVKVFCKADGEANSRTHAKLRVLATSSFVQRCMKALSKKEPLSDDFVKEIQDVVGECVALRDAQPETKENHVDAWAGASIVKAVADVSGDSRLKGLKYPRAIDGAPILDQEKKFLPAVLRKVLVDKQKYKNQKEKDFVAQLLTHGDGEGKKWGEREYSIATDSITGKKTFTAKDRTGVERTFVLAKEDQELLLSTEVQSGESPEKQVEQMKLALAQVQKRLTAIERDVDKTDLFDDKKRKHVKYIDLLLQEVDTFPAEYYVAQEKARGKGRNDKQKDKRYEVLMQKAVSADAVTISGTPIAGFSGEIPSVTLNKAQLIAWKAKLEAKKSATLEKPVGLDAALAALVATEEGKVFAGSPEQRALLDTWVSAAQKADGVVDGGFHKRHVGMTGKYEFSAEASGPAIFFLTNDHVEKWKRIKDIVAPRLPTVGADVLPAGALEGSVVGTDGWEDELGRRIGTKLLMGKLKDMKQNEISKDKALEYVKGLSRSKRWLLYGALAVLTTGVAVAASYAIGAGVAATIGWGALWSAKWFALMGMKVLATAGVAIGANTLLRKKWLDKKYGLIGANGEPLVSFMDRSRDAAGYYKALSQFRKNKKYFDREEGKMIRAKNAVRASGVSEFKATPYQMAMADAMALHERGARIEKRVQFGVPLAIGAGIAGATAWYHWDLIKSLMPGNRPPTGARTGLIPPPTRSGQPIPPALRSGQPIPDTPRGGGLVRDAYGRWVVPRSQSVYVDVYCGTPRPGYVPCDFTIGGTRAHWYINSFADTMRVSSPKGGLTYLLGNMDSIPGGRQTREQVWTLFQRTLCSDPDLYRTFINTSRAQGTWLDYNVLKQQTCINGRSRMMIDVMIERAQNSNVRSTLTAMRESIITNNPRLYVRLAR